MIVARKEYHKNKRITHKQLKKNKKKKTRRREKINNSTWKISFFFHRYRALVKLIFKIF